MRRMRREDSDSSRERLMASARVCPVLSVRAAPKRASAVRPNAARPALQSRVAPALSRCNVAPARRASVARVVRVRASEENKVPPARLPPPPPLLAGPSHSLGSGGLRSSAARLTTTRCFPHRRDLRSSATRARMCC
jgi:hypothetical protein